MIKYIWHDGDISVIKEKVNSLPKKVLGVLDSSNLKIVCVKNSVVEYWPELETAQPRGHTKRKTWKSIPGCYYTAGHTVVVASSKKFKTGSDDFILHEIGHAYDVALRMASHKEEFTKVYFKEYDGFSEYYKQLFPSGMDEVFAESFASFYSGKFEFLNDHPTLYNYWRKHRV